MCLQDSHLLVPSMALDRHLKTLWHEMHKQVSRHLLCQACTGVEF